MTTLSKDDLSALLALEFELPGLRKSVELAERIDKAFKANQAKNPVLLFLFDKSGPGIVENLILRAAENGRTGGRGTEKHW